MKILFIGGTGVISSSCSKLCIEKGYELFLLNRENSFRQPPSKAKILKADINDINSVRALLAGHHFDSVVDWIAFNENEVAETRDLDNNSTIDIDKNGNLVSLTIEHAKSTVRIENFSFQQISKKEAA